MAEMLTITEPMSQFIDWLVATPALRVELGWPANLTDMADHLGYHKSQLYRWKNNEAFKREYDRRLMEAVGNPDRLNSLIEKMFELANDGSVKHAELLLKMAGKIQQGQVNVKVENNSGARELSDEELEAQLNERALDELRARREQRAANDG